MIEMVSYGGWHGCLRIFNDDVELIVTKDVGPRIIRYGFIGGQDMFVEFADQMGWKHETTWQPRGGHRIWIAPEVVPDTYAPDNVPCCGRLLGPLCDGFEVTAPIEPKTGLEKAIRVQLSARGVIVTHRITNCGSKARTLAPWALSMMAPGGVGI